MPIDTAIKRRSTLLISVVEPIPAPTANQNTDVRRQSAWCYPGIRLTAMSVADTAIAAMRAQFNFLIDSGWGTPFVLTRLTGTPDAAGHISGSFIPMTLTSGERIWIQPLAGRSSIDSRNLSAETTHLAFQKIAGATTLLPKDRLLPSGATYVYDVIETEVFETHQMSQLKQDRRG